MQRLRARGKSQDLTLPPRTLLNLAGGEKLVEDTGRVRAAAAIAKALATRLGWEEEWKKAAELLR